MGFLDQLFGNGTNDDDNPSQGSPTQPLGQPVTGGGDPNAPAGVPGAFAPQSIGMFGGDPGLQGFAVGMLSTPKHRGFGAALAAGQEGYAAAQMAQQKYTAEQLQNYIGQQTAPSTIGQSQEALKAAQFQNQLNAQVMGPARLAALQNYQRMQGMNAPPPQMPGSFAPAVQGTGSPPTMSAPQPGLGSGGIPPVNASQLFAGTQGQAIQQQLQSQGNPVSGQPPASSGINAPGSPVGQGAQPVVNPQGALADLQLGRALGEKDPGALLQYAMPSNGNIYGTDPNGNTVVTRPAGWDANAAATALATKNAENQSDLSYKPVIGAATAQAEIGPEAQKALAIAQAQGQAGAVKPITPQERQGTQLSLSKEFQENPQVKDYYEISKNYKTALQAAQDKSTASDINLVDATARTFNPGASVRNSTYQLFAEHSQGLPDNVIGAARSVFNGNRLDPETRAQLVAQMTHRMDSVRSTYGQLANSYQNVAQAANVDPKAVVPPFVDPLTAQEELARRQAAKAASP